MPVIAQPANKKNVLGVKGNEFGSPPNNSNRQPVAHNNYIQTNDATTPNNLLSPLAADVNPIPLVVPVNAVTVRIMGSAEFSISEFSDKSQFATFPAGGSANLDVARQGIIYVWATTTANISFIFQTL